MAWLDLLIIVLLLFSVIFGYKKGFILTLFSIGSYVVAFIFSRKYYGELTNWIKDRAYITERVNEYISRNVELDIPNGNNLTNLEVNNGITTIINQENLKMPGFLQNFLINELEVQAIAQQTIEGIRNQIIDTLATLFLNVVSMIILFILIRWIIVFIGILINKVFELPVLGSLNHMLGGILGGIRGIFIIIIMLFILIPFSMTSPEGLVSISIEESYLVQFFLNNVVIYLVKGLGTIAFF